jgi:hypothetical protein
MKRRPFILYLIAFLFLIASLASFFGLLGVIQSWNWLRAFEIHPGSLYLVFKNFFLFLGFLTCSLALFFRLFWAPRLGMIFTALVTAWFWVDRIFLTQSPLPFSRHIFRLIISLLMLGFVLLSLWVLEPFMKSRPTSPQPKGDTLAGNGIDNA